MNGVRFFTKLISVSQIPFKITTIAIIPESMKCQFSLWNFNLFDSIDTLPFGYPAKDEISSICDYQIPKCF